MQGKTFIVSGALLMALAVILGAFGSHGLKSILTPAQLDTWHTANFYQMVHAVGLILVGVLQNLRCESSRLRWSGILMLTGILLFSGSLYLLSISGIRWLGAITPVGGLAFITAWVLFASGIKRNK